MTGETWMVILAALAGSLIPDSLRLQTWWKRILVAGAAGVLVWLVSRQ